MKYNKLYFKLVDKAKNRDPNILEYYENHHIIPRCLGGLDVKDNIASFTAREHYLAHWLLTKMIPNDLGVKHNIDAYKRKMACAFNNMCQIGDNQKRQYTSRQFDIARRAFSANHPCKDPVIKQKISNALIKLPRIDCTFCNNSYSLNNINLHLKTCSMNPNRILKIPKCTGLQETRICKCGCGQEFTVSDTSYQQYATRKCLVAIGNAKHSQTLKAKLANMSEEEKSEYVKRSLGSCDHAARAKAISEAKRGKSTNQQKIMGERYAAMNDGEFEDFLKTKNKWVHVRLRKLREKYRTI